MDWENQTAKMSILLKWMKRFDAIPIPIPASSLASIVKLTLKFMWKVQRPRLTNTLLKKTEQRWRTHKTQFRDLLESSRKQDSVVLVKEQFSETQSSDLRPRGHSFMEEGQNL